MVVRVGVQMTTGIALMTSIFESVPTLIGSRRAARQDRLTNIGVGPRNLNHSDLRPQHISQTRMENDGAGDDWTTALASGGVRSPTTLTISRSIANARQSGPRPVESDDRTRAEMMQVCRLAVARGLSGDLS